jgi:hypothetical protein
VESSNFAERLYLLDQTLKLCCLLTEHIPESLQAFYHNRYLSSDSVESNYYPPRSWRSAGRLLLLEVLTNDSPFLLQKHRELHHSTPSRVHETSGTYSIFLR